MRRPATRTPAPTRKARCAPPVRDSAVGTPWSARDLLRAEKRATNRAVPAAPATCWTVFRAAEPWEYSAGVRPARAVVKRGVNIMARPRQSTTWEARTSSHELSGSTVERPSMDRTVRTEPGTTRGRGPTRSYQPPTTGPSRPIEIAPGSTIRPVESGSRSMASWRTSGSRISAPNMPRAATDIAASALEKPGARKARMSIRASSVRCRRTWRNVKRPRISTPRAIGIAGWTGAPPPSPIADRP